MRAKIESKNLRSLPNGTNWLVCQGQVDVELFVVFQTSHMLPVAIPRDPINILLDFGDSDKITDVGRGYPSIRSCAKCGSFRVLGSLFRAQDIRDCFCEQRFLVERPIPQFLPQC